MCTYVCVVFTYSLLFVAADSNPRHGECGGRVCTPLNCHLTTIATTMTNNVYAVRMRDVVTHACFSNHSLLEFATVLSQPMLSLVWSASMSKNPGG